MGTDQFNVEIERILREVYYKPLKNVEHIAKRAIVMTEYRHIEFLVNNGLVKRLENVGSGGSYGIQLTDKGYEIFEKFKGWDDYRKKVIDRKAKIDNAKSLATLYWWVPIAISILALLVSFVALFS